MGGRCGWKTIKCRAESCWCDEDVCVCVFTGKGQGWKITQLSPFPSPPATEQEWGVFLPWLEMLHALINLTHNVPFHPLQQTVTPPAPKKDPVFVCDARPLSLSLVEGWNNRRRDKASFLPLQNRHSGIPEGRRGGIGGVRLWHRCRCRRCAFESCGPWHSAFKVVGKEDNIC